MNERDSAESAPPEFTGPRVVYNHGIPGILGGFKIVHELTVTESGWCDTYKRVPRKNECNIDIPYIKVEQSCR